MPDVASAATAFVDRPDISARSTLVTVLGDTIAPLGGQVALTGLFELLTPFPFSQRLIRTSLSRLAAEDWVVSERTGRHSRYHLTGTALAETARAERRIYHRSIPSWTGRWTVVLTAIDEPVAADLQARGFARLGPGVLAAPDTDPDPDPDPGSEDPSVVGGASGPRSVLDRLGVSGRYPVATATFDRPDLLAGGHLVTAGFGLADLARGYRTFVGRYGRWAGADLSALTPAEAFALRTMVVHDLRRLRLRDPLLPASLLPPDWVGDTAFNLAAVIHRAITDRAWRWAADALGGTDRYRSPVGPPRRRFTERRPGD